MHAMGKAILRCFVDAPDFVLGQSFSFRKFQKMAVYFNLKEALQDLQQLG